MSNSPSKHHWGLALPIIVALGLIVDYFFLHLLFQKKEAALRAQTLESLTAIEREVLALKPFTAQQQKFAEANNLTSSSDLTSTPSTQEKNLDSNEFLTPQLVMKCLQEKTPSTLDSLDALHSWLNQKYPPLEEQVDIENYNFTLSDGSERRLHLIPLDNTQGTGRELRFYKVDSEGYPERIALSSKESLNPSSNLINQFLSQGQVTLHQLKKRYVLPEGGSLSLDIRNNKIHELQWRTSRASLLCLGMQCRCK